MTVDRHRQQESDRHTGEHIDRDERGSNKREVLNHPLIACDICSKIEIQRERDGEKEKHSLRYQLRIIPIRWCLKTPVL